MERIEQYKNAHLGQTCAILCGGPSLPTDLHAIPDVDVLIGVNQHANILPLDYLVFSDRHMWPLIENVPGCKFITHLNKFPTDRVIHAGIWPSMGYSGQRAIYAADYMGFDTIYICGMNQYDRKEQREYWWEGPQCKEMQVHTHCNADLGRLKEFIDSLNHPERIYFVSGQLKEIHQ
jgi:hypothetical protein